MAIGLGAFALRSGAPHATAVVRSSIVLPARVRFRDENQSVALSRDGKRLAFSAAGADGKFHLWVRPMESLSAQVLDGTEDAIEPFWSPDGQHIGFFANHKLKRVPAAGGTVQTLVTLPMPAAGPGARET